MKPKQDYFDRVDKAYQFRKEEPELAAQRERMVGRFVDAAKSAHEKNHISELTPDEAIAIAILGGASWEIKDGKMITTEPCGLYKLDGKWTVCLYAPNNEKLCDAAPPAASNTGKP